MSISGKPRDLCIRALTAAFGNPDRAFEYLMTSIPAGGPSAAAGHDDYGDEVSPAHHQPQPGGASAGAGAGVGAGAAGANPFAQLASNPSFSMIRQRILQDPNFYQQFMNQLQQTQPQLFALIQQNPQAFMNLILGGDSNIGLGGAGGMPGMPGGGAGMAGGQGANPPGTIRVSPEEMEAINRLVSLGFPKHKAAEAYFACDKQEELAANFLFENGLEEDDEQMNQ